MEKSSAVRLIEKVEYNSDNIVLTSGKKTNSFYEFFLFTPEEWKIVADSLAEQISLSFQEHLFVVAPSVGGIILGHEVAASLGKMLYIFDKDGKFRPNLPPLARYIIVDDVTSSGRTEELIFNHLDKRNCVGIASLVDRGDNSRIKDTIPRLYLKKGGIEE